MSKPIEDKLDEILKGVEQIEANRDRLHRAMTVLINCVTSLNKAAKREINDTEYDDPGLCAFAVQDQTAIVIEKVKKILTES